MPRIQNTACLLYHTVTKHFVRISTAHDNIFAVLVFLCFLDPGILKKNLFIFKSLLNAVQSTESRFNKLHVENGNKES